MCLQKLFYHNTIFSPFSPKRLIFGLVVVFCICLDTLVIHYPREGICTLPFITNFVSCKALPTQRERLRNRHNQGISHAVKETKERLPNSGTCLRHHKRLTQEIKLQKPSGPNNSRFFKTITHHQDREILRDLLEKFVQVATKHNITFFMGAGTIIGSFRHHGLVPWDDDIDLLIPSAQRPYIIKLLSDLGPNYKIIHQLKDISKFFLRSSQLVPGQAWTYPYIDLYFYEERKHFIHFEGKIHKSLVFPLGGRPFWNFTLPAPKNTKGFIRRKWKTFATVCETQPITHRDAKSVKVWTEKCHNLWDRFPFVFRCKTTSGKGVNETL